MSSSFPEPYTPPATDSCFRLLIRNISEIVALIDEHSMIRFISPQVEDLLELRTVDVLGRNIFEFIHPDDSKRAAIEFMDTLSKPGEGVPSVLRFRHSNGEWIPLEIIANNQISNPAIAAVIFTARDLRYRADADEAIRRANEDVERKVEERTLELARTNSALRLEVQSRRKAERELEHTVSILNATLDSTADGILVISNEGKVTSCNRKFLDIWNLPGNVLGRSDQELLGIVQTQLQDPVQFMDKVNELYSKPLATSFDLLHLKDGRVLERYSQPQYIERRAVGRVWSFRDVTHARELEEELRQSQKMEAIGRLAAGVAHDFNNLLMLISGSISQLQDDTSLEPRHRALCEQVLENVRRAASVTRQLLAFSRKQHAIARLVDLNSVVLDMEAMLRGLISDTIRLELSVCNSVLPVYVDVSQLELVIMNLAINAQDAMRTGGVLTIRTFSAAARSEETPNETPAQARYACLEVKDTGTGMTNEVQNRIFEPFFTTKDFGKGTGLGLSTVYAIVKRAGGDIAVQSEINHGSTFRILLPLTSELPSSEAPKEHEEYPNRGHETILLAEDEGGIRAMTRVYLEGLGYRVLEAVDGPAAIRVSLEYLGTIDLIVSDIQMPEMRGDSMVRVIRTHRPHTKVLYMTGFADESARKCDDHILDKPFSFPELGHRIRSILDKQIEFPSRDTSQSAENDQ